MKKLMIAATILSMGFASAMGDSITSSSIVGYKTVASPAGGAFKALSLQFDDCGGLTSIPVTNLFTVTTPRGGPIFAQTVDQLWTYDITGGWNKYFYHSGKKNWVKQGASAVTTDTLNKTTGTTIFFRRANGQSATTLTLSGVVKPFEASTAYSGIAAGTFRFICYPWPLDFPLNNIKNCQTAVKGGPIFAQTVDQVWTYDMSGNSWVKYFYSSTKKGYVPQGGNAVTDVVIPAGEGFFFRRATGGANETITFTYE